MLEKTLESPLYSKEIQPVHPKGNQSWIFIGRTDVEAETPIVWPPDVKSWLIWKDPVAEKDWGQEEKGTTGDEMVEWHHRLNGHGFRWTVGVGDGQGGLACCSSWGRKEWDTTEWLHWTELNWLLRHIYSHFENISHGYHGNMRSWLFFCCFSITLLIDYFYLIYKAYIHLTSINKFTWYMYLICH